MRVQSVETDPIPDRATGTMQRCLVEAREHAGRPSYLIRLVASGEVLVPESRSALPFEDVLRTAQTLAEEAMRRR